MSIIKMESKDSHLSASKAFFSIACAIFIINVSSLVTLLYESLQIVLFFSGVILLFFSVIPLIEWVVGGFFALFIDNKLSNYTINYWKTLNQPQWESLLNYIIGNIYQELGLLFLLLKVVREDSFFEQIFFTLPSEYVKALTIVFIVCLSFVIIGCTVMRIKRNILKLELSLYFLILVTNGGGTPRNSKDYFLNENWILFQQEFHDFFKNLIRSLITFMKNIRFYIADEKNRTRYFTEVTGQFEAIQTNLKNTQVSLIPFLKKSPPDKFLKNTHNKIKIMHNLIHSLSNERPGNSYLINAFQKEASWSDLSVDQVNLLTEYLKTAGVKQVNGEDWKNSVYQDIFVVLESVEAIVDELESYVEKKFTSFE